MKGLVDQRKLLLIYGESSSGKSLVALNLAIAIATGEAEWGGGKVTPGRVLWIAGEAIDSMPIRLKAALGDEEGRWDAVEENLRVIPSAVRLFDTAALAGLDEVVAELRPALVIVDTLSEAFLGGGDRSENSSVDMQEFVSRAKMLTRHGPTVALIHHATKSSDGRTERGSTALRASADFVWPVTRDDLTVTLELSGPHAKIRDGRTRDDISFRIAEREVERDCDGDPVIGAFLVRAVSGSSPADRRFAVLGLSGLCPRLVRELRGTSEEAPALSKALEVRLRTTRQRVSDAAKSLARRGFVALDYKGARGAMRLWLTEKGRDLAEGGQ